MKNNKKGFTLIEMLVVVLIVGVLVGVAVPQYQRSVQRARLAEAEVMMRAVVPAVEEYCMANSANAQIDPYSLSISYPVTTFIELPVVWSKSGTSFTAVGGSCKDFLKNSLNNPSVISYLFNKKANTISSGEELEASLLSMLAMNRVGRRKCMAGPADPNACAHLGFRLQTVEIGEVCNSNGWNCHPGTDTIWTD